MRAPRSLRKSPQHLSCTHLGAAEALEAHHLQHRLLVVLLLSLVPLLSAGALLPLPSVAFPLRSLPRLFIVRLLPTCITGMGT